MQYRLFAKLFLLEFTDYMKDTLKQIKEAWGKIKISLLHLVHKSLVIIYIEISKCLLTLLIPILTINNHVTFNIDISICALTQCHLCVESILLEMDNKLTKLKMKMNDEHGMASDFLELLMFGTPSTELEDFLLRELGEKGLKKLGTSIEGTYVYIF